MAAPKTGLRLGNLAPPFEPVGFHLVCTTEVGEVAKLQPEFEKRGVKTIGLSCDELKSHCDWIADTNELSNVALQFPIIADATREIAVLYGMLDEGDTTNIDTKGDEILRIIDSLQLGDVRNLTNPANWIPGGKVIVHPSLSTEDAKTLFKTPIEVDKPYLRYTTL